MKKPVEDIRTVFRLQRLENCISLLEKAVSEADTELREIKEGQVNNPPYRSFENIRNSLLMLRNDMKRYKGFVEKEG